jgi:hypothetical protein
MDLCFVRGLDASEILVASVFTFLVRVKTPADFRYDHNRNALRCVSSAYNDAVLQRCRLKYNRFFAVQLSTAPMINRTGLLFREYPPPMFSFANTHSRMLPYQHAYRHQYFARHPLRWLDEDLYEYAIYPMPQSGEGRIADDELAPSTIPFEGQILFARMHFREWRKRKREVRHELHTHTHRCTYPCCHRIFVVNRCSRQAQAASRNCRPLCDIHGTPHIRRLFRRIIRPSTAELLSLAVTSIALP